ncbi:MAG: transcriptional regulator [Bacteroidetes bacterium CG02_land_8_20_14_3_00_31_25]|nr:MAG: transcriptional regulator [Bacteroidetes bacterium CG02_land_8_20_14_3_00_31_25]
MTLSKKQAFNNNLQEVASICKVLSHPARIAILQHLSSCKTCISGDISKEIPLSRTTVSQHLQELKKANLIEGEIDGVKICYCINKKNIKKHFNKMKNVIDEILKENKLNKCCK